MMCGESGDCNCHVHAYILYVHTCISMHILPCDCRVSVPRVSLQSPYKWSKKYRRRTCDLVETMGLSQVSYALCIYVRTYLCTCFVNI